MQGTATSWKGGRRTHAAEHPTSLSYPACEWHACPALAPSAGTAQGGHGCTRPLLVTSCARTCCLCWAPSCYSSCVRAVLMQGGLRLLTVHAHAADAGVPQRAAHTGRVHAAPAVCKNGRWACSCCSCWAPACHHSCLARTCCSSCARLHWSVMSLQLMLALERLLVGALGLGPRVLLMLGPHGMLHALACHGYLCILRSSSRQSATREHSFEMHSPGE